MESTTVIHATELTSIPKRNPFVTERRPSRFAQWRWHAAGLLLLPFLLIWANPNAFFTPVYTLDPWIYFGYYHNLPHFQQVFHSTYFGSRLSVLLPGWAAYHILPPLVAHFALRLLLYYGSVFALYGVLKDTIHRRAALLTSVLFGCCPYFLAAVGWDYVDGFGIFYQLLTMYCLTRAACSGRPKWWLASAGAFAAAMVVANVFYALFGPFLIAFYWRINQTRQRHSIIRSGVWFALGGVGTIFAFCLVNKMLGGIFWFFMPQIEFCLQMAKVTNPWKSPVSQWLPGAHWLYLIGATVLGACSVLILRCRKSQLFRPPMEFFQLQFLLVVAAYVFMEITERNCVFQYYYYATLLLPMLFLALGGQLANWTLRLPNRQFVAFAILVPALLCSSVALAGFMPWNTLGLSGLLVLGTSALLLLRVPRMSFASGVVAFGLLAYTNYEVAGRHLSPSTPSSPDVANQLRAQPATVHQMICETIGLLQKTEIGEGYWFWFDGQGELRELHNAISSTYLWRHVGHDLPRGEQLKHKQWLVGPNSQVAILARDEKHSRRALNVFAKYYDHDIVLSKKVGPPPFTFHLAVARVIKPLSQPDMSMPCEIVVDESGQQLASPIRAPGVFDVPLELLKPAEFSGIAIRPISAGLEIRSTSPVSDYETPPLAVSQPGQYVVELAYEKVYGDIHFGVVRNNEQSWFAQAGKYWEEKKASGVWTYKAFRFHAEPNRPIFFRVHMPANSCVIIRSFRIYFEGDFQPAKG